LIKQFSIPLILLGKQDAVPRTAG